jgi:hypothetical protein
MEQIKPLLLGIILGGTLVYLLIDNEPIVIEKQRTECSEKEYSSIGINENESIEKQVYSGVVNTPQQKEVIKTPDELYEEQQSMLVESEPRVNENIEDNVNRNIIPVELEQAEAQTEIVNTSIDNTLIPKDLQELEANSEGLEFAIEDSIPPSKPEIVDIELHEREVISYELKDLEEYGEEEILSDIGEIPK